MAEPTFLGIKLLRSIVISTVAQRSGVEKSPCCIILLLVASSVARTKILHYVQNDEWGGKEST